MWSVIAGSSTVAWRIWYTPTFIGSMYLSVSSTNSAPSHDSSASQYPAAHCVPVSATASRQHLRSAASHQLVVPTYRLSSYGSRAFSVASPMTGTLYWDIYVILITPPSSLHDYSRHFSFQSTSVYSTLGAVFSVDALCKFTFYLPTYCVDCTLDYLSVCVVCLA